MLFRSNYLDVDDLHFTGGVSSVDEEDGSVFAAYPNPMNENLTLNLSGMENVNNVSLYDMHGRLMEQWQVGATTTTLSVAHLPAGMYMLHVTNRKGRWSHTLIKN